jgi:hypothetical protein
MVEPVNQEIFLNWYFIVADNASKDKEVANFEQAY